MIEIGILRCSRSHQMKGSSPSSRETGSTLYTRQVLLPLVRPKGAAPGQSRRRGFSKSHVQRKSENEKKYIETRLVLSTARLFPKSVMTGSIHRYTRASRRGQWPLRDRGAASALLDADTASDALVPLASVLWCSESLLGCLVGLLCNRDWCTIRLDIVSDVDREG